MAWQCKFYEHIESYFSASKEKYVVCPWFFSSSNVFAGTYLDFDIFTLKCQKICHNWTSRVWQSKRFCYIAMCNSVIWNKKFCWLSVLWFLCKKAIETAHFNTLGIAVQFLWLYRSMFSKHLVGNCYLSLFRLLFGCFCSNFCLLIWYFYIKRH